MVNNGGTITDAVSTQVWSGDAAVHVSIVNWVKGKEDGRPEDFGGVEGFSFRAVVDLVAAARSGGGD